MTEVPHYKSDFFSLSIKQGNKTTHIGMHLHVPFVNTSYLPHTKQFLIENYPSVLRTKCFNDKNLPFETEVNETEIGHLFEHILIDELCALKIKSGAKSAIFNGQTSWNWEIDPRGFFKIWVDIGKKEFELLIQGLKKAILLIEQLMASIMLPTLQPQAAKLYGQPV